MPSMKPNQLVLALTVVLWTMPAVQAAPSAIEVTGAWARSTPPGAKSAAAYLTVVNTGQDADRLVAASTPVAGTADVHRTTNDNGVMKMRPAGPLDVKPGTPVVLSPGGLHVMMMDLKQPLADGQDFPLTLVFEKAGKVQVSVHVQKTAPAASTSHDMGSMGGSMGHMNMSH
ncbi:MAG: copper chaperone PCu(A)C [Alphaproteobacteria bacterium]|nr:copper chaperone PCu(A)C [Alphaproteobacteria bacterium]